MVHENTNKKRCEGTMFIAQFCKLIIYKVYKGSAKIWLNNFQNMNRYYVQRIKSHQKTISNLFISLYKTLLIQIIISRGLKMLGRASQENFSYFINCEWYLPFFLSPFLSIEKKNPAFSLRLVIN